MTHRLTIIADGKTVLDEDVVEANLKHTNPWTEIRSNPALAASMAGAPAEVVKELPGEMVAMHHDGTEVELTYRIRVRLANATLTEFRPA